MNIDPSYMRPVDWSDISGSEIERQFRAIIPRLDDDRDWRAWARIVVDAPEIAALNPPRPDQYDGFVDWARAFNNAVSY